MKAIYETFDAKRREIEIKRKIKNAAKFLSRISKKYF